LFITGETILISLNIRRLLAVAIAAALCGHSGAAVYNNGTNIATFDVTMGLVANCAVAATAMNFGASVGVLTAAVNATSDIRVTCTNTTPFNLGLNEGTGAGSSGTTRFMSGTGANSATVKFNLSQSSGGSLWGNTQGTDTLGGTGTGNQQTLTVYGQIPAQASPAPDTYKSTITATVYF
jgi:spore coat protein U-like protein